MDAANTFQNLLHSIQTSSLNFKIELSPFSANINLKNTFIKDRNGNRVIPPIQDKTCYEKIKSENDDHVKNNVHHEVLIKSLRDNCEEAVSECENFSQDKVKLETVIDVLHSKLAAADEENAQHGFRIRDLESELKEIASELHSTKVEFVKQHKISQTMSAESESLINKVKNIKVENNNLKKIAEKKVMKMKKELDEALEEINKKNDFIKANQEIFEATTTESSLVVSSSSLSPSMSTNSSTPTSRSSSKTSAPTTTEIATLKLTAPSTCSTTTTPSSPPKSPSTLSVLTPAMTATSTTFSIMRSSSCSHQPQCSTRQPKPPPMSKYSFLHHPHSKYREHMISNTIPSRYGTHEYCMRIDHHNYGCEDCVWWKWYGELHGFPDIYPGNYSKYME